MSKLIEQVFDDAIASAPSEEERAVLIDTKRVCEIMRGIGSAADRKAIIGVLEEHHVLSGLADAIVERRVIPFPVRGPARG